MKQHDPARAVSRRPKTVERTLNFGAARAQRIHACADAPQRHAPLEQCEHRSNRDEIAKLELGWIFAGAGCTRHQQRGALPIAQPRTRNARDPGHFTEIITSHPYGILHRLTEVAARFGRNNAFF